MSFIIGLKQEVDGELVLAGESKYKTVAERLASQCYHKYSVDSARVIQVNLSGRVDGEKFNEIFKLERVCKHPNKQYIFAGQLICMDCKLVIRKFDEEKILEELAGANLELEELEISESWR